MSKNIDCNTKHCSKCDIKNPKPLYKKWWFWIVIIIGSACIGYSAGGIVPIEYKFALTKAQIYNNLRNPSKAELYNVLASEEYGGKFSHESAQYAVDNVKADWKENALKRAKSYQESMPLAPETIYLLLISKDNVEFTEEEARYAVDNLDKK